MSGTEEVFLPFPAPVGQLGLAKEVRSTLIVSSIESLRRRGAFDRYAALLSKEHKEVILGAVAGQWFPLEVGVAHYRACDQLGFSPEEQFAIGAEVSLKIHGTFVGVLVKMAKESGVSPWSLLPKGNQIYGRLFRPGGGTSIAKLGPKEARAEMAGVPLLAIPYFRHALRGIYQAGIALFCARVYVSEIPRKATSSSVMLHIAWA